MSFNFGQSNEVMMKKQKLSSYIESILVNDKNRRNILPSPKMVQVVTANAVSDSVFDFPCQFTCQRYKKGSYLRMIKWEINPQTYEIVIHEAQYLGGAGCEVTHGKRWDHEKLHYIVNAKIFSKYFVVFHPPTPGLDVHDVPELTKGTLSKVLHKRSKTFEDQMEQEWPQKRKMAEQSTD